MKYLILISVMMTGLQSFAVSLEAVPASSVICTVSSNEMFESTSGNYDTTIQVRTTFETVKIAYVSSGKYGGASYARQVTVEKSKAETLALALKSRGVCAVVISNGEIIDQASR